MFNLVHTQHGAQRMQQRGLPDQLIRHVIVNGTHAPDGNRIKSVFKVNDNAEVHVVWSMVPAGAAVITAFVRGAWDTDH